MRGRGYPVEFRRRVLELLQAGRRVAAIEVTVAEDLPAPVACRVLEVSQSGFYAWRTRTPSVRSLRHAWLTEQIRQIHGPFRGVYGYRRMHAELTLGHGVSVALRPSRC